MLIYDTMCMNLHRVSPQEVLIVIIYMLHGKELAHKVATRHRWVLLSSWHTFTEWPKVAIILVFCGLVITLHQIPVLRLFTELGHALVQV